MTTDLTSHYDLDTLFEEGALLFTKEILTDSPAGSEKMFIVLCDEAFFATNESEILASGTHFHDVSEQALMLFPGKITIKSLLHSAGEVSDIVNVDRLNDGDVVNINDVEFVVKGGGLKEK